MIELGVCKDRLAESELRVLGHAVEESHRHQQNYVAIGHLLQALAVEDAESFAKQMRALGRESLVAAGLLESIVAGSPQWRGKGVRLSGQVVSLFRHATRLARMSGREKIEAADLLSAVVGSMKAGRSLMLLRVSPPHSLEAKA